MKSKIRKQLAARKRRIAIRLDKTKMGSESPVISASNIEYEIAERSRAIGAGGIGGMQQMVKWLELDREINRCVNIFKIYLPYSCFSALSMIIFCEFLGGGWGWAVKKLGLRRFGVAHVLFLLRGPIGLLGAQRDMPG